MAIYENISFVIKAIVAFCVPEMPSATATLLERHEFVVSRYVHREEDEDDDEYARAVHALPRSLVTHPSLCAAVSEFDCHTLKPTLQTTMPATRRKAPSTACAARAYERFAQACHLSHGLLFLVLRPGWTWPAD